MYILYTDERKRSHTIDVVCLLRVRVFQCRNESIDVFRFRRAPSFIPPRDVDSCCRGVADLIACGNIVHALLCAHDSHSLSFSFLASTL